MFNTSLRSLDSNPGPLESKATTQSTVPQQMVARMLPMPEIQGSNQVISIFFKKNGPFAASFFLYFRLFYKQLTVNKCSIKVADDWIRTRVLWDCKRPLCQLRHNHFPIIHFFLYVCSQADLVIARVFLHLSLGDTNISISIHC